MSNCRLAKVNASYTHSCYRYLLEYLLVCSSIILALRSLGSIWMFIRRIATIYVCISIGCSRLVLITAQLLWQRTQLSLRYRLFAFLIFCGLPVSWIAFLLRLYASSNKGRYTQNRKLRFVLQFCQWVRNPFQIVSSCLLWAIPTLDTFFRDLVVCYELYFSCMWGVKIVDKFLSCLILLNIIPNFVFFENLGAFLMTVYNRTYACSYILYISISPLRFYCWIQASFLVIV